MSNAEGPTDRPRGSIREAAYIFTATVIVLAVVIAAFDLIPLGGGGSSFQIADGQFIDYSISGKLGNVSVLGEVRYYFMEKDDKTPSSFIVTLSNRAPGDKVAPFASDPLLVSRSFDYDGTNLTCLGDLLIYRLPQYAGSNGSELSYGTFGELVDREVMQTSISNGEAGHYISSANGTTLEQWVLTGTGLPVKLRYSDSGGTDITLVGWESNIGWIKNSKSLAARYA